MERAQIIHLVRAFGGSATDAVLDPSTEIYKAPDIEGFVGYRSGKSCLIVYGDPVAAPADKAKLARSFHEFAKGQGKSYLYLAASKEFSEEIVPTLCRVKIEVGRELQFDPFQDPRKFTGTHGSLVRRKVRHAEKEEVVVEEYLGSDSLLEEELEQVAEAWLEARVRSKFHISHIHLFENREGKRWFYAKKNGKVVGVILLNQLKGQKGWLINHLMITPDAPNGTPEILVVSALEKLEQEGCHFATVGYVPSEKLGEITGLGKLSTWLAHGVFHFSKKAFNIGGLFKFWEKFHPQTKSTYLIFSRDSISLRDLLCLKQSLNGSSRNR